MKRYPNHREEILRGYHRISLPFLKILKDSLATKTILLFSVFSVAIYVWLAKDAFSIGTLIAILLGSITAGGVVYTYIIKPNWEQK